MADSYILWGYQPHFRIAVSARAKELFDALDRTLDAEIFLVGLGNGRANTPEIFLSAIESEAITPALAELGKTLVTEQADYQKRSSNLIIAGPSGAAERAERSAKLSVAAGAVVKHLQASRLGDSRQFWVGRAVSIDGALIVPVLSLSRSAVESHPRLVRRETDMGVVPISLIDAAAQELMSRCSRALRLPNAGESIVEDTDLGDALEILARAASHMMLAPVVAGGKIEGLGSLFSVCEALSAEPYERSETQAKLYLCARTHPAIDVLVELAEPVDLRSTRAARKLLQMTASGLAAFSDGRTIWGLGRLSNQPYDIKREDLFEVQFKGRLRWELRHGNTVLFQVDNRRPKFPQAALYREAFEEYVGRIFPQASSKDIAALWSGVSGALDEKHGTIVIISPNAASESLRLAAQGTPIEPKMLDLRAVGAVTRIDGAVLFDPQGVCHALGIILDGLATPDGDRARGSRFNSALKYVSACPGSVAVVVSDDGSVDLLPNLRQRIPRSLVRAALDRLRAVGAGSQGAPPLGRVMDALYSLEFYLSAEECAEVNQLRRTIEAAERIEPYQLRIVYQDVAPDPEMNDSYLIDD